VVKHTTQRINSEAQDDYIKRAKPYDTLIVLKLHMRETSQ